MFEETAQSIRLFQVTFCCGKRNAINWFPPRMEGVFNMNQTSNTS